LKPDEKPKRENATSGSPPNKRKNDKAPQKRKINPFFSDHQAEIMFLLQKYKKCSIEEIRHYYYVEFGKKKVRSFIDKNIDKILEKQGEIIYLQSESTTPVRYYIPSKNFVDEPKTAILLLEIIRGYAKDNPTNFNKIYLSEFEKHIKKNYGDSIPSLDDSLKYSRSGLMIEDVVYESGSKKKVKGIKETDNVQRVQNYLVLIVKDYMKNLRESYERETAGGKVTKQLKKTKERIDHIEDLLKRFDFAAK
jgi:hypothetical protein